MTTVMLLLMQTLFSGPRPDEEFPSFSDLESTAQMARREIYPWIGIEPLAVWTSFEKGLHIDNVWGYGADATVTLDYGTRALLGFRMGYIGWNTRSEGPNIPPSSTWVRQYRIGIFGEFPFRFLEAGIGANVGGYRFKREGNNDTAGYFEFQAMLGVRPCEYGWIGIVAMQTFTSSRFNRNSDHMYINYSIGPAIEARF